MKALLVDINDFTKWIDIEYPAPKQIEVGLLSPFDPPGSVVFQTNEYVVPIEAARVIRKVFFRKEYNYNQNYVEYRERV
jgi:hypothetical protein